MSPLKYQIYIPKGLIFYAPPDTLKGESTGIIYFYNKIIKDGPNICENFKNELKQTFCFPIFFNNFFCCRHFRHLVCIEKYYFEIWFHIWSKGAIVFNQFYLNDHH